MRPTRSMATPYVPASKAGAELQFDVIATAYERNSLLVTTNLPFENWTEVLGNERKPLLAFSLRWRRQRSQCGLRPHPEAFTKVRGIIRIIRIFNY